MDVTAESPPSALVPCGACGASVDPLRAPEVLVLSERFRYLCSRACRDALRAREGVLPPGAEVGPAEPPTLLEVVHMLGLDPSTVHPEALQVAPPARVARAEGQRVHGPGAPPLAPWVPLLAAAVALLALAVASLLGELGGVGVRATVALLALGSLGLAAHTAWRCRHEALPAWALGSLGSLLALLDAGASADLGAERDAAVLGALVPVFAWALGASRQAAEEALAPLRAALPHTAKVFRGATTAVVDAAALRVGDEVLVGPGGAVAVDGIVRAGEAQVLLHPGAEAPRRRVPGDAVLAGARVLEGELRVGATRAGDEVALARLGRSVGAPSGVLSWASRGEALAPAALLAVALVASLARWWWDLEPLRAVAWTLSLAPLSVVLAGAEAPFALALARAAGRGIVFRDTAGVEAAAQVGTVALCLRGTITRGAVALTEVVSLGPRSEAEVIALAATAEEAARRELLGRAVWTAAQDRGLTVEGARRPVYSPGLGVTAVSAAGESLVVGSRRLLLSEGIPSSAAEDVAQAIEASGRSTALVAVAGRVEAVLGFEDPVRDEARPAVQAMMDAGLQVALLGGASRGTLEAIGLALDVHDLRPEVLPEERAAVVRALSDVGGGVAVVGHPGRDGAALAAADVALSLDAAGGAGAETAVALASDDLRDAAAALSIARRARERALSSLGARALWLALGALGASVVPRFGAGGVLLVALGALGSDALLRLKDGGAR
ncbi:MAG: cation-translocating P-type ATPase [Deltaproteobacteria bacterium]|nr:cation-translocating P-type ATPase [Deltaproteobacteria bacterium]